LVSVDQPLLTKWNRIRELRDSVNKEIETLRAQGLVGSSLQADIQLHVAPQDHALLASLGEDLKFIFITSAVELISASDWKVQVKASSYTKCERCWHYRADMGHDSKHPAICSRCTSNLYSSGEMRQFA
jgi:isoleucyl-tRNA synthetase